MFSIPVIRHRLILYFRGTLAETCGPLIRVQDKAALRKGRLVCRAEREASAKINRENVRSGVGGVWPGGRSADRMPGQKTLHF